MTLAVIFLVCMVAAHVLRLRGYIAGHERIRVVQPGWISCELWRKASLVAHRDVTGKKAFPLPQESRTRIWCCAGLPLRVQVQSLGLPHEVGDQIDAVDAARFDSHFSSEFREAAQGPGAEATKSRQRMGLGRS